MEEQNNELKQVFARFQETAAKTDDNGRLEKENKLKKRNCKCSKKILESSLL